MGEHRNIAALIDYWAAKRVGVKAPLRVDIDPGDLLAFIPQILIVGRDKAGAYPVRLAGGYIDRSFGRSIHRQNLIDLFDRDSREALTDQLELCREKVRPVTLYAKGESPTRSDLDFGLGVTPLTGPSGQRDRYLCLLQPLAPQFEGDDIRVTRLVLTCIVQTRRLLAPYPSLITDRGRRVA
jgi:hypothetical protein